MFKDLLREFSPLLLDAVGVAVLAFLGWLTAWLRTRFKINLDEARASAIGIAVTNAAGGVLNKLGEKAVTDVVSAADPSVKDAVDFVRKAVPDAVAHFDMGSDAIGERVINAVGKLAAPAVAEAPAVKRLMPKRVPARRHPRKEK